MSPSIHACRRALRAILGSLAAFWGQYSPRAVAGQVFRGIMADVNEARRLWAEIRAFEQFNRKPDPLGDILRDEAKRLGEHAAAKTIAGIRHQASMAELFAPAFYPKDAGTVIEHRTIGSETRAEVAYAYTDKGKPYSDAELAAAFDAQDPDTRAFHEVRRMIDQA